MANPYLKKWAGLACTTTNSVLFRPHNCGGLHLTPLTTKLKCMQIVKYHQLKYAVDSSTQFIYGHIANHLRSKKRWNGIRELEERERHLALNELCRGNLGRAGLGLIPLRRASEMSSTEHRQELSRLTKQSEEEEALVYVYNMAKQGRPLAWEAVMFLDIRWRRLIYSFSDKLLSFYVLKFNGRHTPITSQPDAVEVDIAGLLLLVPLSLLHALPHPQPLSTLPDNRPLQLAS